MEIHLADLLAIAFQFTHPGGVRLLATATNAEGKTQFQFTHPGGVRLLVG